MKELEEQHKTIQAKCFESDLLEACEKGSLPVVQYLYEVAKVNPEAKDNKWGETALHLACSCNRLPVVQYLCEAQKVNTERAYEFADLDTKPTV